MAQLSESQWHQIEEEYVHGSKSIRQLEREYDVSKTAIRKRADLYGWVRQAPDAKLVAVTKRNILAQQRIRADKEAASATRKAQKAAAKAATAASRARGDGAIDDDADPDADIDPDDTGAAIEASAARDAAFMERAATAAEKSLANVLAALEAAGVQIEDQLTALRTATNPLERDAAIKAIFASGKVNKINSETLRLALDSYRCARGLDDDKEPAPSTTTDQVLGALAALIPQIVEKHQRRPKFIHVEAPLEIAAPPPAEPAAPVVVGAT